MLKNKIIIVAVSFLASCNMAPRYHRPNYDIPEDYRLELSGDQDKLLSSELNVQWWEQFEDAVLNNLITNALANNNELKIAVARVQEYYAILGVVSSFLYPQINGELFKDRLQLPLTSTPPLLPAFRRFNTYFGAFRASYEVDIWGKIQSRTGAAYFDYLAQIEVRRTVVLTLVTEVASSYVELRKLDKQMEISINTLKSRIESERIAKARFQEGFTSELEYKQAESETESAIIAIKKLEILIPQQENLLSVLVGRNPGPVERGKTLDDLIMPVDIAVGFPLQLLQQRPDILQAEDLLIATNFDIGAARAAFFPDITLTGYYGNQSSHLKDFLTGRAVTWDFMINLLQPIFNGGRLISELDIAKARNNETLFNYYLTIQNALKEVNDALIAHKKNRELLIEQEKQVKIFQQYRHLAELQYNNGQSDYLNVLDAERRLFESELLLAETESNNFTSLISLYKALGGAWVLDADNLNCLVTK